ncbi:MAG TPA: outer membrane beta-barrel protein [Burkholderiales bacterium]|nr:outer membrane beta-barrel protein [Burkholderiales bacterium]
MKIARCLPALLLVAIWQQAPAQQLNEYQQLYQYQPLTRFTPLEKEKWEEAEKPLTLRLSGGITYDSNLFRQSDEAGAPTVNGDKDDIVYRVGGGGRYELQASRQTFIAEANVNANKFQNNDNLDNVSDAVKGEWKWQVGNDWNGVLGAGQARYLESFSNFQQNVKDMINEDRIYGSANYLLHSRLKLSVDGYYLDYRHGDDSREVLNYKYNNTAFTVNWLTPALNSVGLQYRTADARYPNDQIVDGVAVVNDFHENEYSIVSRWMLSGLSQIDARFGYTERKFDERPFRNFSDPTWRLAWLWQVTAKTAIEFGTWRQLEAFEDLTANFVRITGWSIIPTWSYSQNIAFRGKVAYMDRKYVGDPGIAPVTERRNDKDYIYQVSALWTPLRLTELALTLETGKRTSNVDFADFKYNSIGASVTRYF